MPGGSGGGGSAAVADCRPAAAAGRCCRPAVLLRAPGPVRSGRRRLRSARAGRRSPRRRRAGRHRRRSAGKRRPAPRCRSARRGPAARAGSVSPAAPGPRPRPRAAPPPRSRRSARRRAESEAKKVVAPQSVAARSGLARTSGEPSSGGGRAPFDRAEVVRHRAARGVALDFGAVAEGDRGDGDRAGGAGVAVDRRPDDVSAARFGVLGRGHPAAVLEEDELEPRGRPGEAVDHQLHRFRNRRGVFPLDDLDRPLGTGGPRFLRPSGEEFPRSERRKASRSVPTPNHGSAHCRSTVSDFARCDRDPEGAVDPRLRGRSPCSGCL